MCIKNIPTLEHAKWILNHESTKEFFNTHLYQVVKHNKVDGTFNFEIKLSDADSDAFDLIYRKIKVNTVNLLQEFLEGFRKHQKQETEGEEGEDEEDVEVYDLIVQYTCPKTGEEKMFKDKCAKATVGFSEFECCYDIDLR
jgi:hypothetical protein